ncbi:MAG: Flp family type IVb pilin [Hyphomicrobiaceae bacterium]
MASVWVRFGRDERGATAIEYALIATFIGIALILGMSDLGVALDASLTNSANAFP